MSFEPAKAPGHRVVIAGAGVAGLEALIALRDLAGDHAQVTVIAPATEFRIEAAAAASLTGRPAPAFHDVAQLCAEQNGEFVNDALASVDVDARMVVTAGGQELPYDSLLVAMGAERRAAFPAATTYRGPQDVAALDEVLHDVDPATPVRVVFVVPSNVAWTLPLYELALVLAERAAHAGIDAVLTVVTAEAQPLGIFGAPASDAVAHALDDADVAVLTGTHVQAVTDGLVISAPGDVRLPADHVVALPLLTGRCVPGLPVDPDGFLVVDGHCRVLGLDAVYAAGDGTSFAIKQGGIAAQQADTAARAIARRAGASVAARPFRPMLRGKLYTGAEDLYLREAIAGGAGAYGSQASSHELWWPPSKVVAPYLASLLEER